MQSLHTKTIAFFFPVILFIYYMHAIFGLMQQFPELENFLFSSHQLHISLYQITSLCNNFAIAFSTMRRLALPTLITLDAPGVFAV